MTIHTFEVSAMLSNENFYNIQKELKSKDKTKWTFQGNSMTYWGLSDKGILINMYLIKKKKFFSYSITYRISAQRVMDNNDYVGLFDTSNYPELRKKVDKVLLDKCSLLPTLNECKMRRLDFCINAELKNQEQVKAYIRTAKRAKANEESRQRGVP